MSKLDWSRVGIVQLDPARVQRVTDFVTSDNEVVPVKPPKQSELIKIKAAAIKSDRRTAARRAKRQAAKQASRERQQAVEVLNEEKKRQAARLKVEKQAAAERAREKRLDDVATREEAELARQQTPEGLATAAPQPRGSGKMLCAVSESRFANYGGQSS